MGDVHPGDVHGALYKETGLLKANGKDIKNKEAILTLLDAVWEPEKVAVMHCRGQQKEDTPQARGNWLADKSAKHGAEKFGVAGGGSIRTFVLSKMPELILTLPQYTLAQDQLAEAERATKNEKGWWELPDGRLLVPEALAPTLVSQVHLATHLGHDKMEKLIQKYFLILWLFSLCRMESWNCSACSQVNAALGHKQKPPGIQLKGTPPFKHLEVDFTEIKPCRHYHYSVVMVCTFSGWVEAFPTWTKKANEVARCLLWEIIPRFGFPTSIGSDNGATFVANLIQQVCKALNIKWTLHMAYRPQSSGIVKWTNWTLKETLSRWIIETDCSWVDLLLTALLRLRMTPWSHGYSLYKTVYGRPPPIIKQVSTNLSQVRGGWDFTADGTTG